MKTQYLFLVVLLLLMPLAACDTGDDDDDNDDNNDNDNDDTDDDAYYDCDDVDLSFYGEPLFFEPLKCDGEEMFFATPEEEPYNSNHATALRSQEELDAILEDFGVSCQVDFERYMVPVTWHHNDWEQKMCDAFEMEMSGNPYVSIQVVDLALKDESLPKEYKRSIHFGLIEATDWQVRFTYHNWGGEVDDP